MTNAPVHIAIIMDGNGRWAKSHNKKRSYGHKAGALTVHKVIEAGAKAGVKYLTFFTFSTENWQRPREEVSFLMRLIPKTINRYLKEMYENNIKIKIIGNIDVLPKNAQKQLRHAEELCSNNDAITVIFAINYGSRQDIIQTTKSICIDVCDGLVEPENIDEIYFSNSLSTAKIPEPDLLIRTSGEQRISNFLLWEIANSVIYITETSWPDFNEGNLLTAIEFFNSKKC
ncbi:MAG TPA: polyprenyl diphosphate synthase [Bacteroidales bacterium]|nr:polyprenyl diphosphate synthase [Bacteroidales bacterium]